MDEKNISDVAKLVKKHVQYSIEWDTSRQPRRDYIWIKTGKPNNCSTNKRKLWNNKLIRKLLLTVTVANQEWFTPKNKPITYTRQFVKLYNCRNCDQVHKIHGMVELEKMQTSTIKNLCNLGAYWIIKISSILRSAYVVLKDQDKFIFYVNNYIDWDQFN